MFFEVLPKGIGETSAQGFSYWSIGNGDDTTVTLWNPADEEQDFVLTLFFFGGHYNYPIHLEPRATLIFNISEIVHNQIPDTDGNVVPINVHEGSGEIAGAQGINQHVLLVGALGVYNVRKATCGSGCWQCTAGSTDAFLGISPFGVAVAGQTQLACTRVLLGGHQVSCSPSWSSSKSSVATVNSTGLVTGVTTGLVLIDGGSIGDENTGDGSWCVDPPVSCPQQPILPAPASGTVIPKITSIVKNFGTVGTNVPVTISGTGFGAAPTAKFDGTGITVTYGTRGNTSIVATFNIAANAPLGVQGVSVTNTTTGDGGSPTSEPVNFQVTPASLVPVDFHLTSAADIGGGVTVSLERNFAWQSSSGANPPTDLTKCSMREYVAYASNNNSPCPSPSKLQCYYPASPPWAKSGQGGSGYPNPSSPPPGPATGGTSQDVNSVTNLNFVKPYVTNSFPSTQYIQYSCDGGSSWTNLYGPISITRSVSQSGTKWIGTVFASDATQSATFSLP